MGKRILTTKDYHPPETPVQFSGVLVAKEWDKKQPCIIMYFDDIEDDSMHYALRSWWRPAGDDRGNYHIPGYDGEIQELELGSVVHCVCDFTKSGKIGWKQALVFPDKVNLKE